MNIFYQKSGVHFGIPNSEFTEKHLLDITTPEEMLPCNRAFLHSDNITACAEAINNKADIHALTSYGQNKLMLSAGHGDYETTYFLTEQRSFAVSETVDCYGLSLMFYTTLGGNPSIFNFILDRFPYQFPENQTSPLLLAAYKGDEQMARLLLQKNASIESKDSDGKTPLLIAAMMNHLNVVKELMSHGANIFCLDLKKHSPIFYSVSNQNDEMTSLFLENGVDPNTLAPNHSPMLSLAAESKDLSLVKLLLNKKADPNAKDFKKWTPLMTLAWAQQSKEIVSVLIENGGDPNTKTFGGRTMLMFACLAKNIELVLYLADLPGIDKGAIDSSKNTALSYAINNKLPDECIKKLS